MAPPPTRLFYVDDPRFDGHEADRPHPECPERLRALRRGLLSPLRSRAERIQAQRASDAELHAAHDPQYVAALAHTLDVAQGVAGQIDADTFFNAYSAEAAWYAAGGAALLGARLWAEPNAAGVLLARPPGHHATRTRAMGFCLLNNVAVAAYAALAQGAARVAIIDWDVHHGNGTADIFAADPRVLFISLHQWPLYPGTGRSQEIGVAQGTGSTINVPLPAGSGDAEYAAAFARVVVPALLQFAPELLLVSCGFDAHEDDPLAGMRVSSAAYGAMTGTLWEVAQKLSGARLGLVLEGGYALPALEEAGAAVAEALLGRHTPLVADAPNVSALRAVDDTRRALAAHFTW